MNETDSVAACPLCAFDDWAYAFTIDGVAVQRCRNCGLARSAPAARRSETSRFAPRTHDEKAPDARSESDVAREASTSDEFLHTLERFGPLPSPLLAVVEHGHSLPALARLRGSDVEELDVSDLDSRPLAPGRFNGALIVGQLERSADPIRSLEAIHDALAADGLLLVAVPSLDRWAAGRFGQWRPERRRARPYYFTRTTLESSLIRSGFSQVSFAPVRWRDRAPRILVTARPIPRRPRPVLSVIMPVYNEKKYFVETMNRVLGKQVPGVDKEIIVVEQHSTDGTRDDVLKYQDRPGVRVILEDRPFGKGHAVRTALAQATGDLVLIQDADDEYDIDDYDELLKPLLIYRSAFVLGSRHSGDWKMRQFDAEPRLEALLHLGHGLFVVLLNVLYGQTLRDPFTMYKVFRRDCVHGLKLECNRFDFDFELVIKLIRKGYTPMEIPVNYRARSWADGKKVRIGRDPLTWIRALVKYRCVGIFKD